VQLSACRLHKSPHHVLLRGRRIVIDGCPLFRIISLVTVSAQGRAETGTGEVFKQRDSGGMALLGLLAIYCYCWFPLIRTHMKIL
jgi:hypothetical protein